MFAADSKATHMERADAIQHALQKRNFLSTTTVSQRIQNI